MVALSVKVAVLLDELVVQKNKEPVYREAERGPTNGSGLMVNERLTVAGAVRLGSVHAAVRATDSVTAPGDWSSVKVNIATPLASVVAVVLCVPIVNVRPMPGSPASVTVSFSVAVYLLLIQSKLVPDVLLSSVNAVGSGLIVSAPSTNEVKS
jgi:hypothetical protein